MKFILRYILDCLLEIIYPSFVSCLICEGVESESFICKSCEKQLSYVTNKFYIKEQVCYSVLYYKDLVKKLVWNFKYKKDFNVGEFFVELLYEKIKTNNIEFDYITYVPMNKLGMKKRGFNQCEYLAKKLSKKVDKEVIDILGKKEGVKEQKTLSNSERRENVKNAFYIKNDLSNFENKGILLIDDVITSGETLKSCAQLIKKNYNIDVFLLTVVKSSI